MPYISQPTSKIRKTQKTNITLKRFDDKDYKKFTAYC